MELRRAGGVRSVCDTIGASWFDDSRGEKFSVSPRDRFLAVPDIGRGDVDCRPKELLGGGPFLRLSSSGSRGPGAG
jgi:hypothetical protein